ncbi:LOW QUALITY PROTEIN: WD repeat-containing protein 93, partial [Calypte anna]|uniref:LOW QUALITY PROTEIN: WD repeat-containing protein 93 n=1 Tax=Calypte anna TaxID=9244 RepID=UPI0011C45910
MAACVWKHLLEIPLPSEKNWLKDEEEDFFLQDPNRKCNGLPQPFRMINKVMMLVFENAVEIIERREMLGEPQNLKVQPTKCFPTAEFQVLGEPIALQCLENTSLSVCLRVWLPSGCLTVWTCAWDAVKMEICAIHASDLGKDLPMSCLLWMEWKWNAVSRLNNKIT